MNKLIPKELFFEKDGLIRQAIERRADSISVNINDTVYGQALRNHLFLQEPSAFNEIGFPALTKTETFYNSYYWFLLFSKLYNLKNGYDAGIEQQGFKILESAPADVDWGSMEKIDKSVDDEINNIRKDGKP